MTTSVALPRPAPAPHPGPPPPPSAPPARPPSQRRPGAGGAELVRRLQAGLFVAGAVLMPVGVVVICFGWYGTAHSHYTYDQNTYLISGGVLGLALTFLGGFLYFGAWLARLSADQRDAARQLTEAVRALTAVSPSAAAFASPPPAPPSSEYVLAGNGTTVHRRDCPLIAERPDLHPYRHDATTAIATTTCRACRPWESA